MRKRLIGAAGFPVDDSAERLAAVLKEPRRMVFTVMEAARSEGAVAEQ